MNYNQILGKINDDTRQKVADEYNKIHKAIAIPEDYSGSVNHIDKLLKNKNIKIDDTLRKKLEDTKGKLSEAIKNKDIKGAAKIVKDLDGLPNIIKDVNAQDILKLVDKRDIAYMAMDKLINKEITNKIYKTLGISSKEQLPAAIQNKRAQIIAIIKTYKHIKNTNPALTNQILKDLSDNVNKQLDEEIKYASNKYKVLAEQKAGERIDSLYTKATGYIDFANKNVENYLVKAQALEDKINGAIGKLDSIQLGGFAKTVNMNLQLSKIDFVSKNIERVNKYMQKYTEIARKSLDRAKQWATAQVTKLATKALGAIGKQIGNIAGKAFSKIKF